MPIIQINSESLHQPIESSPSTDNPSPNLTTTQPQQSAQPPTEPETRFDLSRVTKAIIQRDATMKIDRKQRLTMTAYAYMKLMSLAQNIGPHHR